MLKFLESTKCCRRYVSCTRNHKIAAGKSAKTSFCAMHLVVKQTFVRTEVENALRTERSIWPHQVEQTAALDSSVQTQADIWNRRGHGGRT